MTQAHISIRIQGDTERVVSALEHLTYIASKREPYGSNSIRNPRSLDRKHRLTPTSKEGYARCVRCLNWSTTVPDNDYTALERLDILYECVSE